MRNTDLKSASQTLRDNLALVAHLAKKLTGTHPALADDTLTTVAEAAEAIASVTDHYASTMQAVRYAMPEGYSVGRPADGVRRPVEDLLVAHETRGITPLVAEAINALNRAVQEAATAAYELDHAVARWEATPKG